VQELRTAVCIIGGGPSGLLLAHLLTRVGIDVVVLEVRSRERLEARVRAGLLEEGTVDLLREAGVAHRLDRQGLRHEGMLINVAGASFRFPFTELSGRHVWMYGQQELVKDLVALHEAAGTMVLFEAEAVSILENGATRCRVLCHHQRRPLTITSDFIAGCDGARGVSRPVVVAAADAVLTHRFPFAWLGILADAPPYSAELVYAIGERGFALQSMRSTRLSRLYLQVSDEDGVDDRDDEQIWQELERRLLGATGNLHRGPVLERVLVKMRAFMVEPMTRRRLFLVGDAGHTVPPSAAKGLNLAVADARLLADALIEWYSRGADGALREYGPVALRRAWRAQVFSASMTRLMHPMPGESAFDARVRETRLHELSSPTSAATTFARSYVGLDRG
jgi:p-hydroxybenzoate 3-monooxygenase